jgi:hypothetical protein
MRIISLSSIPPRFSYLTATLESLLEQESVDEVRLYIPKHYRRFPQYKGELPIVPKGIRICQIDEDLGPATKILPAVKDFEGKDVQILFCDDDLIYHKNWAKKLFDIQAKRPNEAVATYGRAINANLYETNHICRKPQAKSIRVERDISYRIKRLFSKIFNLEMPLWRPIIRAGYIDMLFGVGGVVVKPHFFDHEAINIPDEAWAVDDVWLSAQLARNNISLYCPWRLPFAQSNDLADRDSLLDSNFFGFERQESNTRAAIFCQNKYGIWK